MLKGKNWIALTAAGGLLLALGTGVSAVVADETAAGAASTAKPALDGAKVYAWTCGSCHSERWPKERSDADWDVIMTHMRVRANITAEQAEAVLRYLKDNNE